jgi:hypothetical protein
MENLFNAIWDLSVVTKENISVTDSVGCLDRTYGSHWGLKYYFSSVLHVASGVHINPQQSLELDNLFHNNSTVINTEDQTSGR